MNVLIFGLGTFGGQIAACRYFLERGARVVATDLKPAGRLPRAMAALAGEPVLLRLGAPHRESDVLEADLVVASPAVPRSSSFLALARDRGIPVTTEMNLTIAELRKKGVPVYGVTGSNGKTTTAALLGAVLEAAGFRVFVGGNNGRPLLNELDAIGRGPEDRVVLELSSFQLEDLRPLAYTPSLAIVTNITPNHLDRHGTLDEYAAAKRTIVEFMGETDTAVLNRDDPRVLGFGAATRASVVTFGAGDAIPGGPEGLRIRGGHNVRNAAAVAAAARALLVPAAAVERAFASFPGVRDRLEVVGVVDGVPFVNDTASTTPESTEAGILAYPPGITLICGGSDKGMDFESLGRTIVGAGVARLYLIGKTREKIRDRVEEARPDGKGIPEETRLFDTLEEAVLRARAATPEGQVVLFSPGCASFDMFLSFEDRGERFRAAVAALSPAASTS